MHNKAPHIYYYYILQHGHVQIIYDKHTSGTGKKSLNSSLKVGKCTNRNVHSGVKTGSLQHSWSPKNKRSKYPYPYIIIRTETQLRWKSRKYRFGLLLHRYLNQECGNANGRWRVML